MLKAPHLSGSPSYAKPLFITVCKNNMIFNNDVKPHGEHGLKIHGHLTVRRFINSSKVNLLNYLLAFNQKGNSLLIGTILINCFNKLGILFSLSTLLMKTKLLNTATPFTPSKAPFRQYPFLVLLWKIFVMSFLRN